MSEYGLQIIDHRCTSCGNKWVTSQVLFKDGEGYSYASNSPSSKWEIEKNPNLITSIIPGPAAIDHPVCFRCVRLGLNIGWARPQPNPLPQRRKSKASNPAIVDSLLE